MVSDTLWNAGLALSVAVSLADPKIVTVAWMVGVDDRNLTSALPAPSFTVTCPAAFWMTKAIGEVTMVDDAAINGASGAAVLFADPAQMNTSDRTPAK